MAEFPSAEITLASKSKKVRSKTIYYKWYIDLCMRAEALNELHRSQESAYNLRDSGRSHHLARAKICSKLIKYPNIDDYTVRLL